MLCDKFGNHGYLSLKSCRKDAGLIIFRSNNVGTEFFESRRLFMQNQEQTQEQKKPNGQAAQGAREDDGAAPENADLEAQLNDAENRAAQMNEELLRAKAEVENMRRRAQDDIARAHKFAIEDFADALVPVKDSLERALQVDTPSTESLKEGVDMTLKQLSSAFERNRLTEINPPAGDRLDPGRHQAISMVPADQDANTVVNVLQKGYMIADRLLRPALVTVSQQKASQDQGAQQASPEQAPQQAPQQASQAQASQPQATQQQASQQQGSQDKPS
jgi:molecular chaperone GrpE